MEKSPCCEAEVLMLGKQTESPVIVVSPYFMKELSHLPDDQVSFHGALKEVSNLAWGPYVQNHS